MFLLIKNLFKKLSQKGISSNKIIKVGWISTYNTKCGIAEYSKYLIANLNLDIIILANYSQKILNKDLEQKVIRCWDFQDKNLDNLYKRIIKNKLNIVIIQFNFAFFNLYAFEKLIQKLKNKNIYVFVTFHSVKDVNELNFKASLSWIKESLKNIDKIFVHNTEDLIFLKQLNIIENVSLFPHGVKQFYLNKKEKIENSKIIIGSYGFLLPHKGIKELIKAFNLLNFPNSRLLLVNALYPHKISKNYYKECIKLIKESNLENKITFITDFLEDEESFDYLNKCNIIVLPYQNTQESSSAAVRFALSTMRPVLCTPLSIFNDVKDVCFFTKDITSESIAYALNYLLSDKKLLTSKINIQKKYVCEHNWSNIAKKLEEIIESKIL